MLDVKSVYSVITALLEKKERCDLLKQSLPSTEETSLLSFSVYDLHINCGDREILKSLCFVVNKSTDRKNLPR